MSFFKPAHDPFAKRRRGSDNFLPLKVACNPPEISRPVGLPIRSPRKGRFIPPVSLTKFPNPPAASPSATNAPPPTHDPEPLSSVHQLLAMGADDEKQAGFITSYDPTAIGKRKKQVPKLWEIRERLEAMDGEDHTHLRLDHFAKPPPAPRSLNKSTLGNRIRRWLHSHGRTAVTRRQLDRAKISELWSLFQVLDLDGSGSVEFSEIIFAFRALGLDVSDDELLQLVTAADTDGDGSVSFDEFVMMIASTTVGSGPQLPVVLMAGAYRRKFLFDHVMNRREANFDAKQEDALSMSTSKLKLGAEFDSDKATRLIQRLEKSGGLASRNRPIHYPSLRDPPFTYNIGSEAVSVSQAMGQALAVSPRTPQTLRVKRTDSARALPSTMSRNDSARALPSTMSRNDSSRALPSTMSRNDSARALPSTMSRNDSARAFPSTMSRNDSARVLPQATRIDSARVLPTVDRVDSSRQMAQTARI